MTTNTDIDWNRRVLCSDGNCIGVIGPDGRCKVCGLRYDGELPTPAEDASLAGDETSEDRPEASTGDEQAPETTAPEAEAEAGEATGGGWEDRTLCIDGNCIGVIGPDGRCKVCGKPHPGKQP
jgi:rubredoxin